MSEWIELTTKVLDTDAIRKAVERPEAGAVAVFIGNVRNEHAGLPVLRLEYSAQEKLAMKTLEQLRTDALKKFDVTAVKIAHRLGTLEIGEASVVIAVSSGHRGAAFVACRYLIDTLKTNVPIWKKEYYSDGRPAVWVGPDGKPLN
jgi:molybdopterin synthase catalytic subunit